MNINSTQSSNTTAAYSSKGFSGMYSGIDTESLVKSMLSGIQTKIDKQNQSKQLLTWKQEMYRDIIKEVNDFQSKFLDLTSKTSLRLNSFFDTVKTTSSSSAVSVSANSGLMDAEFSVQVARIATSTSVSSSAAAGSRKIEFTANSKFQYDRTVKIKVGDGEAKTIDLASSDSSKALTAQDICDRINEKMGSNFATVQYSKKYESETGEALTKKGDKYFLEDGTEYTDVSKVKELDNEEDPISIIFNNASDEKISVTGSAAGMGILGLSGTAKSVDVKDEDGNVTGQKLEMKSFNEKFTQIGKVNGTVDVTLDGVKKTISLNEGEGMEDFKKKVQNAFGTTVQIDEDPVNSGKWSISVIGTGRNITISANADTMKAMGFEDGKTTVSSQILRSDKIGSLIGGLDNDTEYELNINGTAIKYKASDTVSSIMNKVNSSVAGVRMSFNDLNNTFNIESTSTGQGFDINITKDTNNLFGTLGFDMAEGAYGYSLKTTDSDLYRAGENAILNINGTTFERSNNSFVYDGVTVTLKGTTGSYDLSNLNANGSLKVNAGTIENKAEIKTTRDTDKVVDALKEFVEDYNTLIEKLNKLTHEKATYKKYPPLTEEQKKEMSEKEIELWEEKAKEGLLRNDRDISSFLSDMRAAMYSSNGSGIVLSNIGIDSSSNWQDFGKLSIDEDKLKSALEKNASAIQKLFTGENGLANKLSKACKSIANTTSGSPGALVTIAGVVGKGTEKNNEIQKKLEAISKRLTSLNMLYEKRKTRYWKQFNSMETSISNMDSQSSWLSNFMSY